MMAIVFMPGGKGASGGAGSMAYNDTVTDWDSAQTAQGLALDSFAGGTVSQNGANVQIDKVGGFTNTVDGVYIIGNFIDQYTDDEYEVLSHTDDAIVLDLAWTGASTGMNSVVVGGAGAMLTQDLQKAFDLTVGGSDVPNIIKVREGTWTLSSTIDVDTNSGTAANHIVVEGVDSTNNGARLTTADTLPVITTNQSLVNGLLHFTTVQFYDFHLFDFDGGAPNKADYCIFSTDDGSHRHAFTDCKMHNADSHGCQATSSGSVETAWRFINCEVYDNGGDGITGRTGARGPLFVQGCDVHDNDDDGIVCGSDSIVVNTLIYNNADVGLLVAAAADAGVFHNITIYGNGGIGLQIQTGADFNAFYDISSSGNIGVNYDFGGDVDALLFFGYNHSFNGSAHYSEGADSTWADFANGNNIGNAADDVDPLFTSVVPGSEDFTPLAGSPLIGAGVNGATIGALPPEIAAGGNRGILTGGRL